MQVLMERNDVAEKAKQVRWSVFECHDKLCWCAGVTTEIPVYYQNGEEYILIPTGNIDKIMAEYIVKLHNDNLDKK